MTVVMTDSFVFNKNVFLINIQSRKKNWTVLKAFLCRYWQYLYAKQNLVFQKLHSPVTKHFFFALCTAEYGLVLEWLAGANWQLFIFIRINRLAIYGAAMIFQNFYLFIHYFAKNVSFFGCFCKLITLYISGIFFGKLTINHTSSVPNNSVNVSCTPIPFFCAFVRFWITKNYARIFPSNKAKVPKNDYICQLNIYYNARHSVSKLDGTENGRQKEFYITAKEYSDDVTKHILVIVQPCISWLDLCHNVTTLIQQHNVALHVVDILRNDKFWSVKTSYDNQYFHKL